MKPKLCALHLTEAERDYLLKLLRNHAADENTRAMMHHVSEAEKARYLDSVANALEIANRLNETKPAEA